MRIGDFVLILHLSDLITSNQLLELLKEKNKKTI